MRRFIFISIISLLFVTVVMGQRRITPVESAEYSVANDKKSGSDSLKGKNSSKSIVIDGFEKDSTWVDSTMVVFNNDSAKIVYPLMNGITVGVNIWDPVMRALGQEYGLIDFSGEVNLYNRFFPSVEVGLGAANSTPETGNFTYNAPMSLYAKIGGGYNFLYSKNSDYKLIAGFRLGFSSFNYEIVDAVVSDGYWGDSSGFSILDQSASAVWGEFNLGVRVNIYNNWSMGWMVRMLYMFSCTENEYSSPGYIPGYGKSSSSINGAFSLFYTIPLKSKVKPKTFEVDEVIPHNHNHNHNHGEEQI
ncbi:MAG: DUF6048 family protein [Bacteroidales bacterium]